MLTIGRERMLVLVFALLVATAFILPVELYLYDWPRQDSDIQFPVYAVVAHAIPLYVLVEARHAWPFLKLTCNQLIVAYVLATMLFLTLWFSDLYEPYLHIQEPIDTSEGTWDPEAVAEHEECLGILQARYQFVQFDDIRDLIAYTNKLVLECDRALLESLEE